MSRRFRMMMAAFLFCLPLVGAESVLGREIIEFQSDRWALIQGEVVEHLGRSCLMGAADLNEVVFTDGVIEFDMAVDTARRSYPGVVFHTQAEGNHEIVYLRPHRCNGLHNDALQYTPVVNGISSWQLYNGEGFTAPARVEANEWIHVRLEVLGARGRVYLGDAELPALEITRLQHGAIGGGIGLRGERNGTAYFSNFSWLEDESLQIDQPSNKPVPLGLINRWELSQAFPMADVDFERTPAAQGLEDITWTEVESLPSGLVDVGRHTGRLSAAPDCVAARTILEEDRARTLELKFGYSDAVSVFLNGRLVFFGNSAYKQRSPGFLGIVGLNDTLFLEVDKGSNELLLLVGESFGGWGFICQDGGAGFQHHRLTRMWNLPRRFRYPESAVYDEKRGYIYISNFFNGGKEFISRLKPDGVLETLEWVTGLNRPTGLCLFGDRLHAVDRSGLLEIDPDSGEITGRVGIPGAVFINDVAIDADGQAYVSDSGASVIHVVKDGKAEVWLEHEEISDPNGLCLDGRRLLVGNSGDGCLKAVSLVDRSVSTVTCLGKDSILDGIDLDGQGNIILSDFNGRVFLVTPDGSQTELLNMVTPGTYCADLEFIPGKNLLVIPTLYDNDLVAYRLVP